MWIIVRVKDVTRPNKARPKKIGHRDQSRPSGSRARSDRVSRLGLCFELFSVFLRLCFGLFSNVFVLLKGFGSSLGFGPKIKS